MTEERPDALADESTGNGGTPGYSPDLYETPPLGPPNTQGPGNGQGNGNGQ